MSEERKAYERFKLQWMIDHGFTLSDLIAELQIRIEESEDYYLPTIFQEWEFEYGFDSQIWPCFEEWLDVGKRKEKKVSYAPLRKVLHKRGMTFATLGNICGFAAGTRVSLSKDRMVQLDVIKRVCEALDCSVEDVVEIK